MSGRGRFTRGRGGQGRGGRGRDVRGRGGNSSALTKRNKGLYMELVKNNHSQRIWYREPEVSAHETVIYKTRIQQ